MKGRTFFAVALSSLLLCGCGSEKKSEALIDKWEIGKGTPSNVKAEVKDNILYIKGKGDMKDFTKSSETPWYKDRDNITDIKIEEGLTYIGKNAFFSVPIEKLVVPKSIVEIHPMALNDETSLYIYNNDLELDLAFDPIIYIYQEDVPETHDIYWQSDYSKTDIVKEIVEEEEQLIWHFDNDEAIPWKKQKILFIGNSFTYRNGAIDFSSGVPGIFNDVATDLGYYVETYSITGPGWYLDNHAKATDTCGKQVDALLKAVDDFDFIVLQEQSVNPFENYNRFLEGVTALKKKIDATQDHAKIYLYETWGSPYSADERKISVQEMEMKLRDAYDNAAKALKLDVTYVGRAFTDVYVHNPDIYLWDTDHRHQGYTGAYLSACTHVGNMLGGDVRSTNFNNNTTYRAPSLSDDVLKVLRQAAYDSANDIVHDEPFDSQPQDPPAIEEGDQSKIVKVACWGRFMKQAKFESLIEDYKTYCRNNNIELEDIIGSYYVGPNNTDAYYYIANFSAKVKEDGNFDIVLPCADNFETNQTNVTVTSLSPIDVYGQTNRRVATTNNDASTLTFVDYIKTTSATAILASVD